MNDPSSPQPHIHLHDIQREERTFLMRTWCQQLLSIIEGGEPLDDLARSALLTARTYVNAPTADRIDALLGKHEPESNADAAQGDGLFSEDNPLFGVAADDPPDDLFGTEDRPSSPTAYGRATSQQSPKSPKYSSSLSEGDDIEELPIFTPSVKSPNEDTPGFIPTQGDRKESTIGKREKLQKGENTGVVSGEEAPGETDIWDVEEEEAEMTEVRPIDDDASLFLVDTPPGQSEQPLITENSSSDVESNALFPIEEELSLHDLEKQEAANATDRPKSEQRRPLYNSDPSANLQERRKREKERFSQQKKTSIEAEGKQITAANSSVDERLSLLTHIITLDHLEKSLGLKVIPEDRLRIEQQFMKKLHDPAICSLMDQAKERDISLVVVPRIQRAFFDDKLIQITGANLLRLYAQFFEDIQQVSLKMRAETHFLQETPQMGWGLTTAEVLTESHNTNYTQQETVLKLHAYSHKSNEMRVRRRTLIEALFDLLAVKIVTGKQLLHTTADLTGSKIGRVNLAVINYGESGIRISDINRQQAHPQLGVCPTW